VGKERRPQRIHPVREGLFAMAGLWDEWRGADPPLRTFTIITTDANQTLAPLHHRMPVILHPADEAVWLDPGAPVDALAALLRPCPEPFLAYYPITDRINRVDSEGPECIAPPRAQEPLQPTLF
jgi:putative SOS response-associated peptidase YedK